MENCKQCGEPLTHVEGRKEKSFCNTNCRNKYFYARNKKIIADAMINGNGKQEDETETAVPSNDEKQKRISELEKELKSPPKNPQIGIKNWIKVRQNEISDLQKQLNPPI